MSASDTGMLLKVRADERAYIARIAELKAALAEAREDAVRLEWASANPSRWGKRTDWTGTWTGEWWAINGPVPGIHPTLRAAIDAARGKS